MKIVKLILECKVSDKLAKKLMKSGIFKGKGHILKLEDKKAYLKKAYVERGKYGQTRL